MSPEQEDLPVFPAMPVLVSAERAGVLRARSAKPAWYPISRGGNPPARTKPNPHEKEEHLSTSPEIMRARNRLSALSRWRSPDDPELPTAARDLAALKLAQHIQRVVAAVPPFTHDQRARLLRALLGPAVAQRAVTIHSESAA